jgi:hypothetical protein
MQDVDHSDKKYHRELNAFLSTLNRDQQRLFAALESNRIGRRSDRLTAKITGVSPTRIARGRRELADLLQGKLAKKDRKPVPGRPRIEDKYPALIDTLEAMVRDEVAGSPEGGHTGVRSSVAKLTKRLREKGFQVGHSAVWQLLKRMKYSMRTNVRKRRGITRDPSQRDEQFCYIASQRKAFQEAGRPIISVDTKKKELIGDFRNPGRAWCGEAEEVDEHGFPSAAECVATPFGVYDVTKNTGYVVVGLSHNTPEFAVSTIVKWWLDEGRITYPEADHLLLLADGGGGNGNRARAWKFHLQEKLCNKFGLMVTVCHYPPGCSKWNPVEHRLFSQISINWEGKPLRSLEIMLGYIRGTTTTTGLSVKAHLDEGIYKKGLKVAKADMARVNFKPHSVCPALNYTISPVGHCVTP